MPSRFYVADLAIYQEGHSWLWKQTKLYCTGGNCELQLISLSEQKDSEKKERARVSLFMNKVQPNDEKKTNMEVISLFI